MLVAVNTSNGGDAGERLPVFKYDARAGRIHLMDRVEQAGEWSTVTRDITMSQPTFAVDFGSVEIGWLLFPKGGAPMMVTVPFGQPEPPEPPAVGTKKLDNGKEVPNRFGRGFRLKVGGRALASADGRMVREFSGNAQVTILGVNDLHTQFTRSPEAVAGKIPVVKVATTEPMKSGQSTNYKPVFEIVQWVDRDEKTFGKRTVPAPSAVAAPPPPAPVAAAPAAAAPVRQPDAVDADALPF